MNIQRTGSITSLLALLAFATHASAADFSSRIYTSHDFLPDAIQALPLARRGDAEAQYFLYAATEFCASIADTRKRPPAQEAARESALSAQGTPDWQQVRRNEKALCSGLSKRTAEFSGPWLSASLAQGFPLALAVEGRNALLGFHGKARKPEGKVLLVKAINSANPYAVFEAAPAMSDKTARSGWLWYQAACELGFDCSERSRFVFGICGIWQQEACNGSLWLPDLMAGSQAPRDNERQNWMADAKRLAERIRTKSITEADVLGQ